MKRIRRIVAWVLAVVLGVALVVGAAFVVSPVPSIMLFRNAFKEGHTVEPPRFDEVRRTVQVTRDQEYPSSYRRHTFDLYRPRRIPAHAALPVIVWVHGGGFIAGDKSGLSTYATLMAARGYAVIAMNYDYAPTGTYPTPVVQLGQMVSHVAAIAQRERLDPDRIVVGGDSAGAQIAAQFAAVQTTPGYAESSGRDACASGRCLTVLRALRFHSVHGRERPLDTAVVHEHHWMGVSRYEGLGLEPADAAGIRGAARVGPVPQGVCRGWQCLLVPRSGQGASLGLTLRRGGCHLLVLPR